MGRLDTEQIMAVALEQAGLSEVPADSAIYIPGSGLRRALLGIDIDVGELLFAREAGFDVVVAHHPIGGNPVARFGQVMWGMVDQMAEAGIAEPIARAAVAARIRKRGRRRHVSNYNRVLDTARLIGLPLLNIHLPPDIVSRAFVQRWLTQRVSEDSQVGDLLQALAEIPEVRGSLFQPEAWIGEPENPVGRYVVAMAGGTNGGFSVFKTYFDAGVSTIIAMHIDEDDLRQLQQAAPAGANLVIAGHMAMDSIGLNRLIDGLQERGLEVRRTSGIIAPDGR